MEAGVRKLPTLQIFTAQESADIVGLAKQDGTGFFCTEKLH